MFKQSLIITSIQQASMNKLATQGGLASERCNLDVKFNPNP